MKVGIIGAGTMGLTLAYRLSKAGQNVTVFEAAPQVGGLGAWFDYGDFVWDKYYHVILQQDSHLLGLIRELGIDSKLNWVETKTGFLCDGKHISLSNSWEFLRFPLLNLFEKARLAAGILYVQRLRKPSRLERIKVGDWMARVFGARVYQTIWEPLLRSKYGALTDQMPATIMWATIRRYYSTRSKGGGRERMGFLSEGFRSLYDGLVSEVTKQGAEVHCSTSVETVEDLGVSTVRVHTSRGCFEFDRLISTVPTRSLQKIVRHADDLFDGISDGPVFLGVVCLAVVLRRPLNGYYVTNLIQRGFPFTGIIGVSNLAGTNKFNGLHFVMLPRYEVCDSPWFQESPQRIAKEFIGALKTVWPDIEDNLVGWHLSREPLVQALWIASPPTAHGPAQSRTGRLWSINAEIAGRDTLNNNAIIKVANDAATKFLDFSRTS